MVSTRTLAFENFGRMYQRGRWAVRNLSLVVPFGVITALVGPNGAGKTTLLRAALGFEPADEGRVLLGGYDVARDRVRAIGLAGYLPQGTPLYESLTAGDHFKLARSARREFDAAFALSHLRGLGVPSDRAVGSLSGGERAQVALAVALGVGARVLILDEPLASLDPLARREFLSALVSHLRSHDAAVILSSHLISDVEQACDRIAVVADGDLVLHMSLREARASFRAVSPADLDGLEPIGTFSGPDGRQVSLVPANGPPAERADLEEVVLGHIAARRRRRNPEDDR